MKTSMDERGPPQSAGRPWIRLLGFAVGAYLLGVFVLHRVAYIEDATDATLVSSTSSPRALATPASAPPRRDPVTSAGVLHVHTGRSHDAVGTIEEVARAARATGLAWVIVSDHQNNQDPAPVPRPKSLDGVTLLFSQERGLDREMGRVLVEGVDTVVFLGDTTEKLREVAARPGVLGIVSHPRSPSEAERWKAADAGGSDAWEVFNVHEALVRGSDRTSAPGARDRSCLRRSRRARASSVRARCWKGAPRLPASGQSTGAGRARPARGDRRRRPPVFHACRSGVASSPLRGRRPPRCCRVTSQRACRGSRSVGQDGIPEEI